MGHPSFLGQSGFPTHCTRFAVDGVAVEADARMLQAGVLSLVIEGRQYRCVLDADAVVVNGKRFKSSVADLRSLAATEEQAPVREEHGR